MYLIHVIKLISLALHNKCIVMFDDGLLTKLIDLTENRDTDGLMWKANKFSESVHTEWLVFWLPEQLLTGSKTLLRGVITFNYFPGG
jgi:hypothetical protein